MFIVDSSFFKLKTVNYKIERRILTEVAKKR